MMTKLIKTSISKWLYGLAIKLNPNLRFDNVIIEHTYPDIIPVVAREPEDPFEIRRVIPGDAFKKIQLSNTILARIRPYIEYSTFREDGHNIHEARINIVVFKKK